MRWLAPLLTFVPAILAAGEHISRTVPTDRRIAGLERQLQSEPGNVLLLNRLTGAYLQKMRESADGSYVERAARLVASVLKTDASNFDARRYALELQMQRHEFEAASSAARKLLTERPDDAAVLGMLGDSLVELGQYEAAESVYQKMLDRKPGMSSYSRVAYFRFLTGDAPGAIELMRQAVRMRAEASENSAWCLAELGQMLFKTGALDEAEENFRRALALFPGFHPALAGMGKVLAAQGRRQQAVEYFRKAQATVPLPDYAAALATLYRQLGDPAKAKQQLDLLDVYDSLGRAAGEPANRSLALAFADLNYKVARSLELATAELAVRRDVYTYDTLAWALFRNGKKEEAAAAMRLALAQGTPDPSFQIHAAEILR